MHHTLSKFLKLSSSLFFFLFLYSCQQNDKPLSEDYLKADKEFRERLAKGRDHYLKLVGLHPLVSGTNFFGASQDNNIQLTSADIPPTIGVIEFSDDDILFTASDSVEIRTVNQDSLVSQMAYEFDTFPNSPMLKYKHLEWQVIKRAEEYFLRVKDQNSKIAKTFKGFEAYPLKSKYVVIADYRPFEKSKTEDVNTQLGTAQQMDFKGILSFELNGMGYELSVGEGGFLIVGDLTNDETTYGGGRYLYVDLPQNNGKVTIDFNRLYNPPCVYSEFTTCPLPPAQNILPLKILAGEKYKRL
ncbi:MAG: DUF1684 domain-containing protein [Reichenbachiella sp.]|uniref:DUF1684 domain-containing protein n=1 Tax=Reichenbachiella sp. TaxID=2184521 RepID=UPI0032667BAB